MLNNFNLSMSSADWIDYNFKSSEYPLEWTLEFCVNTFNLLPEKVLRHEDLQGAPLLILANKQVRSAGIFCHIEILNVLFCIVIF